MCLHDIVAEELTDKKSLAALIYLICHGRELEFEIEGGYVKSLTYPLCYY